MFLFETVFDDFSGLCAVACADTSSMFTFGKGKYCEKEDGVNKCSCTCHPKAVDGQCETMPAKNLNLYKITPKEGKYY